MKVSIIIPNYNTAHFLPDAFESVLSSSIKDYEIILVDDGSTDNAKEVIAKYLDVASVRYIYQENQGLASARNTGIDHAAGEYVVFLDSDDVIKPEKLAKQASFLDDNSDYDVVFSDSEFFIEDDFLNTRKAVFPVYQGQILDALLDGNIFLVNAIMARKEAVKAVGKFDPQFRELEDWDLWLRMGLNGSRFGYIPEVLSLVRLRRGSMTNDQKRMYKAMVRVTHKIIGLIQQHPSPPLPKNDLLVHAYHSHFAYRILANERQSFYRDLLRTWRQLGGSFLPYAIKSSIKFPLSHIVKPNNQAAKQYEEVW